jgi:hypothetical protein
LIIVYEIKKGFFKCDHWRCYNSAENSLDNTYFFKELAREKVSKYRLIQWLNLKRNIYFRNPNDLSHSNLVHKLYVGNTQFDQNKMLFEKRLNPLGSIFKSQSTRIISKYKIDIFKSQSTRIILKYKIDNKNNLVHKISVGNTSLRIISKYKIDHSCY